MGDDGFELARVPPEELTHPFHRPRDREAVKSETPDSQVGMPGLRQRISGDGLRQAGMKGGVEAGDVRHPGERGAGDTNRLDGHGVMEWRQLGECFELRNDSTV